MKQQLLAVASLILAMSAHANAGSNDVNGPTAAGTASISLSGMKLYQTALRATPAIIDLTAFNYTAIPDLAATLQCKSGVSKCVIVAQATVQIAGGGSTSGLGICPTFNGNFFDQIGGLGACLFSDFLTGYVNHSNVALVSRPPGSKNVMGLTIHPESAAQFRGGNVIYSVYYK